jgi:hypothetical protein
MEKTLGNLFSAMFLGKIDENEKYYTEDMIKGDDLSLMILGILVAEKIVPKETINRYRKEFVCLKNEQIKKEIKELFSKNTQKESVENEVSRL